MRRPTAAAALLACALAAGCSTSASYEDQRDYLRKMAQQGAEIHALIASQEAVIDKPRCERAFTGMRIDGLPYFSLSADEQKFLVQVQEFFVDSCVSGKPKEVPGDPASAPAPAPSPSS